MKAKQRKLKNPFIYQGYESPEYFCDREKEMALLKSHLQNGRNVTLVSPRRIGKTGLIKNTFYNIREENPHAVCLYLDIYSTKDLHDFVQLLGSVVLGGLVSKEADFLGKTAAFFSALRPVVSMDPLTGAPNVSVTVEPKQEELSMKSVFSYLSKTEREVYLAIDEFQQIKEYPEKGVEALLRSYIQFTQHVHFIFSGSKFHLMAEIFSSPKHPFYQSTEMINLTPLDPEVYYRFCRNFFKGKGGDLSKDVFRYIYDEFEGHTWYVQCLMNRLYETCTSVDGRQQVQKAMASVLEGRSAQYEELVQFFTSNQYDLLKAIAQEELVEQPMSSKFIREHNLSGASSVKAALKVLLDKELVYRKPQGYVIYDRFMDLWLKRQ